MKRSSKAALLSGLAFPGLGHIYLRKYLLGVLLLIAAAIPTYMITSPAVHIAADVSAEIGAGEISLDIEAINDSIVEHARGSEQSMKMATNIFVLLWVIGVVDSYRVGRQGQDS